MSTTGFVPYEPGTLIGLGGQLRAGKDAVAEYLRDEHDFVVMGMSDALNEALLKLNPIIGSIGEYGPSSISHDIRYKDLHDEVGYVEAKKNPEVRRLLQVLGTEVGRDMIDPDVWVDIAVQKIRAHWAEGKKVVITAMRFPNELKMLQRMGGLSIWIDRPAESRFKGLESFEGTEIPDKGVKADRLASSAIQGHVSENSVSEKDFMTLIVNDGTLEKLYENVEDVLRDMPRRVDIPTALPYDR